VLRIIQLTVRGRGRRLREAAVIFAFDAARIRDEVKAGKARSLRAYLEELMPAAEQFEQSMERMFARLDAAIARQEARKQ
jgi:hypothetical protein